MHAERRRQRGAVQRHPTLKYLGQVLWIGSKHEEASDTAVLVKWELAECVHEMLPKERYEKLVPRARPDTKNRAA